jgi:hypothetical protein
MSDTRSIIEEVYIVVAILTMVTLPSALRNLSLPEETPSQSGYAFSVKRVVCSAAQPANINLVDSTLRDLSTTSTNHCTLCCNQQHDATTSSHQCLAVTAKLLIDNRIHLESLVVVAMPSARRTRAMGYSPGGPKALDINAPTRHPRKAKAPAGMSSLP